MKKHLPALIAWLLLAALALAPAVAGCFPAFTTAALRGILAEARQWALLRNSLCVALGGAAGAVLLGAPAGYLLARGRVHAAPIFAAALAAPLLTPPYVLANAWLAVLGNNGMAAKLLGAPPFPLYNLGGVALVTALTAYPIVAFTTAAGVRGLDARIEDAARMHARPGGVLVRITLPLLAPMIGAGAVLVFLLGLLGFAVPSLLQVQTYPVEIYARFNSFYDPAGAAAKALPLIGLGAAAYAAWRILSRCGAAQTPVLRGTTCRAPLATCYCLALAAITAGLPLAALTVQALPLRSLAEAWRTAAPEIGTSLLLAVLTATCGTAIAFLLARQRLPLLVSAVPFLLSGPVLGVGIIRLWNHAGPMGWVYDSFAILLLTCLARYLVFGHFALSAALGRLDPALEAAAATCGASASARIRGIVLPLAQPALAAVWGMLFILTLGEIDAILLVCPPGWTPLSVRVFTLLHYGPSELTAALALLTGLLVLGAAAIIAGFAVLLLRRPR